MIYFLQGFIFKRRYYKAFVSICKENTIDTKNIGSKGMVLTGYMINQFLAVDYRNK